MFVDASGARAVGPAMATVAATQDLPVVQAQFLASGAVGRPPPDRVVQRAPLLFALPPGNSIGHRPDALAAAPSAVAITSPSPAPPTFVWRNQALPGRATVGTSEVATAAPMLSLSPAPQPPISAATPGAGAAEAVPAATTVSGRTAAAGSGEAAGVASPSVLAEQVLRIVERRLEVERERRGGGSPWS
jgi:hypothetical protein